jgi:hypothetical protein
VTYLATWAAIETYFAAQWAATAGTASYPAPLPVQYPNVSFSRAGKPAYCKFQILDGSQQQVALGGQVGARRHRTVGLVQGDIFAPEQIGEGAARELADQFAAIFRGATISGCLFRAPLVMKNPAPPEGYYGLTVSIDFQRDEDF